MRFRVLGPLSVSDDHGTLLRVPQARQRALLCVLLLHANEWVDATRLAGLLWGADVPGSGAGALRTHIWALRRVLAPARRLHQSGHGYRLEVNPGELDLEEFRQLAAEAQRALAEGNLPRSAPLFSRALRLWREPTLADIPRTRVMQAAARRLLDEHQAASEALTEVRLALGQHRELIPWLRAQATADPAQERRWEHLMLALYRCGRRAEALAAFAQVRRALADEYGIDPGPELTRLQQMVLADDPALSLGGDPRASRAMSVCALGQQPLDGPSLRRPSYPL
jgi:DNA-binding SARP family transcriptional activator